MLLITLIWSCSRESMDQGIEPITHDKNTANTVKESKSIPPPVVGDLTVEVNEEVMPRDIIARMITGSSDAKLSFQILEDQDELFVLTTKGELSLADGKRLDYETKMEHNLRVAVSDGVNDPVDFKVSITVLDDQELKDEPSSFVTEWNMGEAETLTIGTHPDYLYDFFIDWGDGTVETVATQNPSHQYEEAGIYTVAINGEFPAMAMQFSDDSSRQSLIDVLKWGDNPWATMEGAFFGCEKLKGFSAVDIPDLSQVESLAGMFQGARIFNQDISNWDTSNISTMERMFQGAISFNQDIDTWNTESVTTMKAMFRDTESFDQELKNWNTANVEDISFMFYQAKAFDQNLEKWAISSITTMEDMLSLSGISQDAYGKTLIGWSSMETDQIPDGIVLGAESVPYCDYVDVVHARKIVLIEQNGWIIKDAGMKECK